MLFPRLPDSSGAGYFGSLWSLVAAMDLRTAFAPDKLSTEVGKRYREKILQRGGELPAPELVRDFLGRDSNSNAFFDYLKTK